MQGTNNVENIHDEFLQLVRFSGIENIAKESGIIQNGEIPELREYSTNSTISMLDNLVPIQSDKTPSNITKSRRRKTLESENDTEKESKKKKRTNKTTLPGEKLNKGLRHFSMKVCEKVENKKATNYNEVADELVTEFRSESGSVDEKNIRRRVYDALNVLMAMNIIAKDKRDIRWLGLPTNAKQELESLEREKFEIMERIKRKKANLEELFEQHQSYQHLIDRNSKSEFANLESRINLPFIIVNTSSNTVIECEVADDRTAYFFNFTQPFEIHDDSEILKRLSV